MGISLRDPDGRVVRRIVGLSITGGSDQLLQRSECLGLQESRDTSFRAILFGASHQEDFLLQPVPQGPELTLSQNNLHDDQRLQIEKVLLQCVVDEVDE